MMTFLNLQVWAYVAFGVALVLIFLAGRLVYRRSLRIMNQLQMSYIFTNITHELLTPLTIISASVERMRSERHDEAQDRDFSLIDLNIVRMQRLLLQILETSKSQAGELKLLVSHGDVMGYIQETAQTIEPLMSSKGLQFTINCRPASMMGWIDNDKIDKIIFNLLSNAAKYTPEGGKVDFSVTTNRKYDLLIIRVSDTGSGIPKDQMKRLFSRFHDGEYRRNQTFGTGLGLSLTRDLVHLHRGTIRCDSTEGQGTTFTVELPIKKEAFAASQIDEANKLNIDTPHSSIVDLAKFQPPVQPTEMGKPVEVPEDAYRILIVEDNTELLMLMKELLQSRYFILTATNGREALEVVRSNSLDLIVSDVMMPEMDGYELTSLIKEDPDYGHLPIILLTAKTQEESRKQALMAGADGFITKPFRLGELQLSIDNVIGNRLRIHHDIQKAADTLETASATTLSPMDSEFMQRAIRCIADHLTDSDYDREAFAADMGASASTLYNKLRELTGMSVSAFIRNQRIKTACRMAVNEPDLRVSDIAYRVGFKDPKYFATSFKKEMGCQPKEYFDRIRNEHHAA